MRRPPCSSSSQCRPLHQRVVFDVWQNQAHVQARSGLRYSCTRWLKCFEHGQKVGGRHLAAGLLREMGRQAPALRSFSTSEGLPCGRRSEVVGGSPSPARRRFCRGIEGSDQPPATLRRLRQFVAERKTAPSPEFDWMRLRASRSPASRRRRRFSARSASTLLAGTSTRPRHARAMRTPHHHEGCSSPNRFIMLRLTRQMLRALSSQTSPHAARARRPWPRCRWRGPPGRCGPIRPRC